MKIVGYTWNAAVHCVECTQYAFFRDTLQRLDPYNEHFDENGLPETLSQTVNDELVGVMFDTNETDTLQTCDICNEEIDTIVLDPNLTFSF